MIKWKLPAVLLTSVILVGLGLQFWYWPQLPDQIATHFDGQGKPDDLISKLTATFLSSGMLTILPLFFLGISKLIRRLPTSTINLPNREFWLAPERRDETLSWMTGWMLWFTTAITLFMASLNHLTFIANRDAQPLSMVWFWVLLGTFLFATVFLVLIMIRRFSGPGKKT
jgi:uncharacterized membrane protein